MIKCDTSKLEQQLKKFHEEAIKKLEGMVQIFAYKIAWQAIENTPFGDSILNAKYYDLKSRLRWFLPYEGSAKGGWTVTMNIPSSILVPERAADESAENIKTNAEQDAMTYKLGDKVYITNSVPYMATVGFTQGRFGALEKGYSGQAPNGVMQPTKDEIIGVYQLKLDEYYRAS